MSVCFDDHGHTLFSWGIFTTRLSCFLFSEDSSRLGEPSINLFNGKSLRHGAYERFVGRKPLRLNETNMSRNRGAVRLRRHVGSSLTGDVQLSGLEFALFPAKGT